MKFQNSLDEFQISALHTDCICNTLKQDYNQKIMKSRKNILQRMIIYIVLLLFLVGVVASVANYVSFVRIYFQQTGKYIGQIADQAALNINSYLQEITRLCLSPYYDVQVMRAIETPGENAQDFLARKRLIEGYLEQVMTIPRSDVISVHILSEEVFGVSRSYGTAIPSDYKDKWWYKQALEDDGYIFLPGNGNRMFSTIHRLRSIDDPNKVIGVIKVDANFSGIQDIFDRITLDDSASIDIRDSEGGILYRKSTLADDVANSEILTSEKEIPLMGWTLCFRISTHPVIQTARLNLLINIIIAVAILIFGTLVSSWRIRKILGPLYRTIEIMERVSNGEIALRIPEIEDLTPEISQMNHTFNQMLDHMAALSQKEKQLIMKAAKAEVLQKQAQFDALNHQIRPHFLFNTLNTIILLIKMGRNEKTVTAVGQLATILRGMINADKFVCLNEEINICKCYIELQQLRHDTLQYDITASEDADMDCLIPAMTIQPVVENCFIHAFENKNEDIILSVDISVDKETLVIEVTDNGDGMSAKQLEEVRKKLQNNDSSNVGLSNINNRLKLIYGPEYGISIDAEYGLGTIVTIIMPHRSMKC